LCAAATYGIKHFKKLQSHNKKIHCKELTYHCPFALSPSLLSIVAPHHLYPGLKVSLSAVYFYASPSFSVLRMPEIYNKYDVVTLPHFQTSTGWMSKEQM
jgi:hypothetical protein